MTTGEAIALVLTMALDQPRDRSVPRMGMRVASITDWQARMSKNAPRVPWADFLRVMDWHQGEHVGMIGTTGSGKTQALVHILPEQPFVVLFATKPYDETMDYLLSHDYARISEWDSRIDPVKVPRRVLWPDATKINSSEHQRDVFKDAFSKIYRERGWVVALDEGWYFSEELKLKKEIRTYLLQARSLKISLVLATQRPAWVPLEVYDQSTHLFFWKHSDRKNLDRLGEIASFDSELVRYIVPRLEKYQLLYLNTRDDFMLRTRPPGPVKEVIK